MHDAGAETLRFDDAIYRKAGLDPPPLAASEELQSVLKAGLVKTEGLFRNLTKTTADTATKQFEDALDRAYMQITTGAFDRGAAVRMAIKDLARQGVGAVRYPSEHVDTIEVAVRRAVVTGVNQTALRLQETRADEMDCDLVETTAHGGARPEHAHWQGQIFSRSGSHATYPDFVRETGYGTGAGLGGWNCRHSFFPYIEGSPRTYTPEMLKAYEEKNYTYNGHKMTEYEATQKQRYIERKIRRWKRENAAMQAAGLDATESAAKIAQWQETQRDFIKQTGLKRQSDREQVAISMQSDIIKLHRKSQRRTENTGAFSSLSIAMQKREVHRIARRHGIGMTGITIKIQRNEGLLALPIAGSTDYRNVGRIDLFPNAFVDEEQLVRTIIHEKCHVKQLQKHGAQYAQMHIDEMEKQAYRFESFWYKTVQKRVSK